LGGLQLLALNVGGREGGKKKKKKLKFFFSLPNLQLPVLKVGSNINFLFLAMRKAPYFKL
jgi:hypothetical protein